METKLLLMYRGFPEEIAKEIISFISPTNRCDRWPEYHRHVTESIHYRPNVWVSDALRCACLGFYEGAHISGHYHSSDRMSIVEWNAILTRACEHGHIEIVRRAVHHGADAFGNAMIGAAIGGYLHILKWMIAKLFSECHTHDDRKLFRHRDNIRTAIIMAAHCDNIAALRVLIGVLPADMFIAFSDIMPPISVAAINIMIGHINFDS